MIGHTHKRQPTTEPTNAYWLLLPGEVAYLRLLSKLWAGGRTEEKWNGLECFGMFYMGGESGDCGVLREIVECNGRMWNVGVKI